MFTDVILTRSQTIIDDSSGPQVMTSASINRAHHSIAHSLGRVSLIGSVVR